MRWIVHAGTIDTDLIAVGQDSKMGAMNVYAGIGSRKTPGEILLLIKEIASMLGKEGYILRTGGAVGADSAFMAGASRVELYLPWRGYNGLTKAVLTSPTQEAFEIASKAHPSWEKCSGAVRKLHARNAHIILGMNLDNHVRFVICWTPGGKDVGGTGVAIRIAQQYGVPVYNLAVQEARASINRVLDGHREYINTNRDRR